MGQLKTPISCLDSQELDNSQNYQDRIISQSAVQITGSPLEIPHIQPPIPNPPWLFLEYFIMLAQRQIICLPCRFLMTTLHCTISFKSTFLKISIAREIDSEMYFRNIL